MKKRTIAGAMALLLLLLPLCCCLSSCGEGPVITLYVYNWGEYISDGSEDTLDVNALFEEECRKQGLNVRVNYSTFSSNEDMYARIKSGAAAYDVIIPSDYMIQRMVKEQMLQPLGNETTILETIPNYAHILDEFKGENVYYEDDSDQIYSVPYFYGMIGIIYNTTLIPADEEHIGSWDLMWDEEYRGDILQFNNSRDAFGTALYKLKYDVNEATEAEWMEALELLKQQKSIVQGYVMDEIFNKMKSGSAAVAAYYAGDFLSMYEDNSDLAFYYPLAGGTKTNSYVDAMCIPTNAQSPELARAYINFMCREDVAVANAEYTYYASPHRLVRENADYRATMSEVHEDYEEILYGNTDPDSTSAYLMLSEESMKRLNLFWEELKIESSIGTGIYVLCGVILAALAALVIYHVLRRHRWSKLY